MFTSEPDLVYKDFTIESYETFLPSDYKEVVDSSFLNGSYIDRKLKPFIPTTELDTSAYDKNAIEFEPYVNDSGVVLCDKDMALYIKDRSDAKRMRVELKAQSDVNIAIIKGAVGAEKLYRSTIRDLNGYNEKVINRYSKEKAKKTTWRNIALFILSFGSGYLLNEHILNR